MPTEKSLEKVTDLDIMLFLDGELHGDEARAVEAHLAGSSEASAVAQGVSEIGELVRGSLELEADAADEKLASLWNSIESGIASKPAVEIVPMGAAATAAEEKATRALVNTVKNSSEKTPWFASWQSHIATGALVAAAVAILMFTVRGERIIEKQTTVRSGTVPAMAVDLKSQAPVVEELEVYEGSGVIMTVHGDEEAEADSSAVIWISSDNVSDETDLVEDPI